MSPWGCLSRSITQRTLTDTTARLYTAVTMGQAQPACFTCVFSSDPHSNLDKMVPIIGLAKNIIHVAFSIISFRKHK